jgi:hypothetical protein
VQNPDNQVVKYLVAGRRLDRFLLGSLTRTFAGREFFDRSHLMPRISPFVSAASKYRDGLATANAVRRRFENG